MQSPDSTTDVLCLKAHTYLLGLLSVLVIYYPLSVEVTLFRSAYASQPKLFDVFYFLLLPMFGVWLLVVQHRIGLLLKVVLTGFLLLNIFALQYSYMQFYGSATPKLTFLLRYLQYISYVIVLWLALERFGYLRILFHFGLVSIIELLIFIRNFLTIPNPLDQNIIGSFRGSFDAGAYFVIFLALLLRYHGELRARYGDLVYYTFCLVTGVNLLLSSSRTAIGIGALVLIVFMRKTWPILAAVGLAALIFSDRMAIKAKKIVTLFSSLDGGLMTAIASDRSVEMRMANFDNYLRFLKSTSNDLAVLFFGSGPGAFQAFVSIYDLPGTFDCYPLRILSEYGVFGLLSYLIIVLMIGRVSILVAVVILGLSLTSDVFAASKVVPLLVFTCIVAYSHVRRYALR